MEISRLSGHASKNTDTGEMSFHSLSNFELLVSKMFSKNESVNKKKIVNKTN